MKTLIVYATKHGCTETCAKMLSEKLIGEVDLCNLQKKNNPVLSNYDRIIIGGSIHIGKIQKEVRNYCACNIDKLRNKKIGLFVCGMLFEKADEELNNAFPEELLAHALVKDFFGGEFRFGKMNPLDRMMVKKVANVQNDLSQISEEKIMKFAELMNSYY